MLLYKGCKGCKEVNSFSDLIKIAVEKNEDGIYYIPIGDIQHYIKLQGFDSFSESSTVLVGFSGAKKNPGLDGDPVFSFSGIASSLGIPLIAISDPSLMISEKLTLCWYLGNDYCPDYLDVVTHFLDEFSQVSRKKMILAGGSGGGFAALNFSNKMSNKENVMAIVWNPQVVLKNYNQGAVDKYIKTCCKDVPELIESKVDFSGANSLIFMDGLDHAHLRLHLRVYLKDQGCPKKKGNYYIYGDKTSVLIGDWGGGHAPPPKWFIEDQISQSLDNWHDFESYVGRENKKKKIVDFQGGLSEQDILNSLNLSSCLVGSHLHVSTNLNKFFVGFQIRYRLYNKSGALTFSSGYLKNYHACAAHANLEKEDVRFINLWKVGVVIEDLHGNEKELLIPLKGRVKVYEYMEKVGPR